MDFFDDHTQPATPFLGDMSGDIFNTSAKAVQTQLVDEHFIETQSGFLIIVKKLVDSQSVLVKRRLGTPPKSTITLTPDESKKLCRALGDRATRYSNQNQFKKKRPTVIYKRIFALVLIMLIFGSLLFAYNSFQTNNSIKQAEDLLGPKKLESFIRYYVSNILDFNPSSYRVSQIRAMACMTPVLAESYWKNTNFPLTKKQIKALAKDNTPVITKVSFNKIDDHTASADVFAELNNTKNKKVIPYHIMLKLQLNANAKTIQVYEQKI